MFDVGLLSSVGLSYTYGDLGRDGNLLSGLATTWGTRRLELAASDRYTFNDGGQAVQARLGFQRRQDLLFLGLGPDVTDRTRSRYGLQQIEGGLGYRQRLVGPLAVGLEPGLHHIAYIDGDCCGDPSLGRRIADGGLPAPPGYGTDYTAIFARAELTLDTRDLGSGTGSGLYLRVHGDASFDVGGPRAWIEHGEAVGGAVDLNGHHRVLRLELAVDFADPLRGDSIPFNEQASLGSDLMPGFVTGWMVGRSTAAAELAYSWPIWLWLHGQLLFAVGNAFGEHLDGFALRKLRFSGDVGITASVVTEHAFGILFGIGTETFEQGAGVTSVRLAVGWRGGL